MLELMKYPNTNYSGIMLDYYIKKLNEVIGEVNELTDEVDKLPGYVKNIEIINNAYLKVTFGNGNIINYALPSGNHFLVDLYDIDTETVSIFNLNVGDEETYNTSLTDYRAYADSLYAGVPVTMRYIPGGSGTLIAMVNTIAANPNPSFMIWDDNNDTWKVFTLGIGVDNKAQVIRVY